MFSLTFPSSLLKLSNTLGETKQVLIVSRVEQKSAQLHVYHSWPTNGFLKPKISRLQKLRSRVNARMHQFPAPGRPHSFKDMFGRGFCNESVCRFVFSPFYFLWSDTMIPCWWKFYFSADFQERNQTVCDIIWRNFVKNHDDNRACCDWLKLFSSRTE